MVRVGVIGYGTIGRRVADAVTLQPDMQLMGIVKTKADYKAKVAASKGYAIYVPDDSAKENFRRAGMEASGFTEDLLARSEVIVDTTPAGVGAKNRPLYEKFNVRAIFEGGEKRDVADQSFVAQCNFEKAHGKKYVRVVSCNTTGLCRAVGTLDEAFGVEKVRDIIVRKATDPDDPLKGPVDSVNIETAHIPTHHGPDLATVIPHVNAISMVVVVPTTRMHFHNLIATLRQKNVTDDDVIEAFEKARRTILVDTSDGIMSTAQVMDYARELQRPRSDLYELAVWRDAIKVIDDEVYMYMAVHMESIVIPENIDAIRSMLGLATKDESMRTTNKTLGIAH